MTEKSQQKRQKNAKLDICFFFNLCLPNFFSNSSPPVFFIASQAETDQLPIPNIDAT